MIDDLKPIQYQMIRFMVYIFIMNMYLFLKILWCKLVLSQVLVFGKKDSTKFGLFIKQRQKGNKCLQRLKIEDETPQDRTIEDEILQRLGKSKRLDGRT